MKCSKCGYEIERPGKFCPKCGNPLPANTSDNVPNQNADIPPHQPMNNGSFIPSQNNDITKSYIPPQNSSVQTPPPVTNNTPPSANTGNNMNGYKQPQYQYQNQNNVKPPKKRGGCLKVFLIIIGIFVALIVGISAITSSGTYKEVVDYDEFRDDDTEFTIEVNAADDDTQYEIDIYGLNNYAEELDLGEVYEIFDDYNYQIKDMCFDLDTNSMYLLAKDDKGKYMDVQYDYNASFTDDAIHFELECMKFGNTNALLALGKFGTFSTLEYVDLYLSEYGISLISAAIDEEVSNQKIDDETLILTFEDLSQAASSDNTPTTTDTSTQSTDYEDEWTVMIYMNGSNLEYTKENNTYDASASTDIDEMLKGTHSDKVNIVIETGGTLSWYRDDIDGDHNQRFEIADGKLNKIADLERRNMCEPSTLSSFTDWAVKSYPANNYVLIFWDHGGGSLYGFGFDEYFPTDSLTLPEIDSALNQVTTNNNMKFELIGFDACLMGTVETANMLVPYANYYLASEESEPGHGWSYSSLMDIISMDTTTNGEILGTEIVYGFISQATNENSVDSITLSNIDLSQMDKVNTAFDNLIKLINDDIAKNEQFKNNLLGTIPKLLEFSETDHYDMVGFAREMTKYYPAEANRLIEAIDKVVVANGAGYDKSTVGGLSLYIPYYDLNLYNEFKQLYKSISIADSYSQLCDNIASGKQVAIDNAVTPEYTVDFDERPFTITFSEDYYNNYLSNVYINIYELYDDGTNLIAYDYGYDAWCTELESPAYTFEESFSNWPCMLEYPLALTVLYFDDDIIKYSAPIKLNDDECDILFTYNFSDQSYYIEGYVFYQENTNISDRTIHQFTEGDMLALGYYTTNIDTGEEYYAYIDPVALNDENFLIEEWVLASGDYAMQFAIEDYTGQMHYTDPSSFHFE